MGKDKEELKWLTPAQRRDSRHLVEKDNAERQSNEQRRQQPGQKDDNKA
jgi:hypothetical protein